MLVWPAMIGVSRDQLSHVAGRVLVQLLVLAKDENGNIYRAKHRELMRLLEKTALALQEGAGVRHVVSGGSMGELSQAGRRGAESYTERFLSSLIALISIFLRPILRGWRH